MARAIYLWLGSSPSPDESSAGRQLKIHSNRVRYIEAHPKQHSAVSGRPSVSLAAMLGSGREGSTQTPGGTVIQIGQQRPGCGREIEKRYVVEVVPQSRPFSLSRELLPIFTHIQPKNSKSEETMLTLQPGDLRVPGG